MTKFLDISRELEAEGFREVRRKGSHHIFKHAEYGTITGPHESNGRGINPGLVCEIKCQVKRAKRGLQRFETMK